jgi:hypothetical protein
LIAGDVLDFLHSEGEVVDLGQQGSNGSLNGGEFVLLLVTQVPLIFVEDLFLDFLSDGLVVLRRPS